PRGDGDHERALVVRRRLERRAAQVGLLHDVLGLGHAAEHPVRDREQQRAHLSQEITPSRPRAMHVFIAGATGTIGHTLIPTLLRDGHEVTGRTRSEAKADALRALGARPVIMDGLDRESVRRAVEGAAPDVVIHEMTALAGVEFSKPDKAFAITN